MDSLASQFGTKIFEDGDVNFWLCLATIAYELLGKTPEHALWKKEANIVWKGLFQLGNVCNL